MFSLGRKSLYIVDSLIILLNISNSYSIVPYLLFHQHSRAVNTGIIFVINVIFLLARFNYKTKIPHNILFEIYVGISVVNVVSSFLTDTGTYLTWLYLFANATFFLILYNCYVEYEESNDRQGSLWLIIRGYIWLVALCIGGALLLFVLMKLGLNPYHNEISSRMDLFDANVEQFDSEHYYPYYLSILVKEMVDIVKMPFFYDKGYVCGLYHEPHIFTFMVFPALFFLLSYIESPIKKATLFVVWGIIMLMTTSTMNIIAFLICIILYLSFDKWGKLLLIPISWILVMLVIYIGLENTELFFIIDKLEGGSMDYSWDTIVFAFTPKTLLGSNFINTSFLQEQESLRRDVGYIPFLLNIFFLIIIYLKTTRTILSDKYKRMLGLGILYFMLHSMKVSMVAYSLSMLIFMMFVASCTCPSLLFDEDR